MSQMTQIKEAQIWLSADGKEAVLVEELDLDKDYIPVTGGTWSGSRIVFASGYTQAQFREKFTVLLFDPGDGA